MKDVVVGIDASTTAIKAIAFSSQGEALYEARRVYPLNMPKPGYAEQNAEDWWKALAESLQELTTRIDPQKIAGLAISHQRETFTLLDESCEPIIPAILWLDERARQQVAELSAKLGREHIRDVSGKPPDPTPALYAIAWLNGHHPETVRNAYRLSDVSGYLHHHLTGNLACSLASADPLGLVNLKNGKWDMELAQAAGLRMDQLPKLVKPGAFIGGISSKASASTGLLPGTPVYAGAGDGQATGLGLGATSEGRTYLSLGSGIVSGMFAPTYKSSDAFRTLSAPSGEGYMLETVLRSGMQLVEWVLRTTKSESTISLEMEASKLQPGSDGLMILPYFSGVMSPYWDETARGGMIGLSLSHTPAHLYRAAIEGIAFEQAIATAAMEASLKLQAGSMIACGGGTNSKLLMTILSTVVGREIAISPVKEASALGAAILAAVGAGLFENATVAASAMCSPVTDKFNPDSELAEAYKPFKQIYSGIYAALKPLHQSLHRIETSR
jgi:xylulokinase